MTDCGKVKDKKTTPTMEESKSTRCANTTIPKLEEKKHSKLKTPNTKTTNTLLTKSYLPTELNKLETYPNGYLTESELKQHPTFPNCLLKTS